MRLVTVTAFVAALTVSTAADAASFTCGVTMCRLVGIQKCGSLALALEWARKFPKVGQPAPGLVVVQKRRGRALGGGPGGHVSLIVSVEADQRFAVVRDNRGTYRRNIQKNRVALVAPSRAWTE